MLRLEEIIAPAPDRSCERCLEGVQDVRLTPDVSDEELVAMWCRPCRDRFGFRALADEQVAVPRHDCSPDRERLDSLSLRAQHDGLSDRLRDLGPEQLKTALRNMEQAGRLTEIADEDLDIDPAMRRLVEDRDRYPGPNMPHTRRKNDRESPAEAKLKKWMMRNRFSRLRLYDDEQ